MTDLVVVDHVHDEAAGVFRLIVGTPVYDDAEEPALIGYEPADDIVFSALDPQWHEDDDPDGPLRSLGDIAAEQRAIVRDALTAPEDPPPDPPAEPTPMPGVGEPL